MTSHCLKTTNKVLHHPKRIKTVNYTSNIDFWHEIWKISKILSLKICVARFARNVECWIRRLFEPSNKTFFWLAVVLESIILVGPRPRKYNKLDFATARLCCCFDDMPCTAKLRSLMFYVRFLCDSLLAAGHFQCLSRHFFEGCCVINFMTFTDTIFT